MNKFLAGIGLCAFACATTAASADDVALTFNGLTGGGVTMRVHYEDGGGTDRTLSTAAGRFEWNGNTVNSFCVELTQYAGSGNFDCVGLDADGAPFSDDQVDAIAKLYEQFSDGALDFTGGATNDNLIEAAAFQMVLWEIVSEKTSVGDATDWDIEGGTTSFSSLTSSGTGALFSQAESRAVTMLTAIQGSSLLNSAWIDRLRLLQHDQKQDQLILVPLPAPLAFGALGVLGVMIGRRRFR